MQQVVDQVTPEIAPDDTPAPPPTRPDLGWRLAQFVVLAIPVLVLGALVWKYRTMYDDGFINLHVVQQVLAGHGPVFNTGQRVEAFTSPLWLFVLVVLGLVTPFHLEWIAVVTGMLLTLLGVTLAIFGSMRLYRRTSPRAFFLPLGTLILVGVFALWTLATTGLETGLTCAWIGACCFLLARWATSGADVPWYAAVVLGLGPLVRPELLLDSLVFLGLLLFMQRSTQTWRGRVRLIVAMAALPFCYQVFRMGYYGQLVSTTAVAKEAAGPRLGSGLRYLWNFLEPYGLLFPLAAVAVGAYLPLATALRRKGGEARTLAVVLALPLAGLLNAGYIVLVGGDYMHARLLLPALFAVCAPISVVPVAKRYAVALLVLPWALISGVALRPSPGTPLVSPVWFRVQPGVVAASDVLVKSWYRGPGLYYEYTTYGKVPVRIDDPPAPGVHLPAMALSAIGLVSYVYGTGVDVIDEYGLANPIDAHLQLVHRGLTGHEKPLPTPWLIALMTRPGSSEAQIDRLQRNPLNVRMTNPQQAPLYTGHELAVKTAWARAALECPAIVNFERSYDAPLTVGRFFSNIVHSVSDSTLAIPPDPEAAYHKYCGPGTPESVRHLTGR